jgi:hypothetical protein
MTLVVIACLMKLDLRFRIEFGEIHWTAGLTGAQNRQVFLPPTGVLDVGPSDQMHFLVTARMAISHCLPDVIIQAVPIETARGLRPTLPSFLCQAEFSLSKRPSEPMNLAGRTCL